MSELFFQITLSLGGAIIGAFVQLLQRQYQILLIKILLAVFIIVLSIWLGYELGIKVH